jgi:hypothetical protein
VFRTSNLDRLFTIVSSLEEALAAVGWSLAIKCPIAACEGQAHSHERSIAVKGGDLRCQSCGCRFRVAPFQLSPSGEARVVVSQFELPTYEHEHIRAEMGVIVNLYIAGRLDLFAAEALIDALGSLPRPRRTVLDLRAATELSDAGLRLVEEHLRGGASGDQVVVLVDQDRAERARAGLPSVPVTATQDEATSVLSGSPGSEEAPAPLLVATRTALGTPAKSRSTFTLQTPGADKAPPKENLSDKPSTKSEVLKTGFWKIAQLVFSGRRSHRE